MTRLLMTADTVGGVWTYALELAGALAPHGVEVHLATMGPPLSPRQRAEAVRSPVASVTESSFALEWMPDPWAEVDTAGEWLLDVAAQVRPDVVHLNGYAHAVLPWPAPVVVVAHSDVLSWWRSVHGVAAPAEWAEYRRRVAAGLAAADTVVAPTSAVLTDLARGYGCTGGTVVPNCRRSDWAVAAGKEPLVLAAGRVWDEAKNLALLDAVAPLLRWPVSIAGDGGGSANFLGPLGFAELAPWLLRASVFAAPARYEPFGLAILEAGLAGCALVLGDIASLREVWGESALYVDPDNQAAWAATLGALTADPAQVADLGQRARRRAGRYTPARTAAGYLEIFRRLAAVSVPS
jgi:glycogen synthase